MEPLLIGEEEGRVQAAEEGVDVSIPPSINIGEHIQGWVG